jgi:drug/metabolite transporter (DMT)-like permease
MPKLDLKDLHQRGILFLALGLLFVVTFLAGGGVISSTNGGYWTGIFFLSFLGGLLGIGPFVYRSANNTLDIPRPTQDSKWPLKVHLINTMGIVLMIPLSQVFFRSELFRTPVVMHLFIIGMGMSLSMFFALGLGFTHAHAEQQKSTQ